MRVSYYFLHLIWQGNFNCNKTVCVSCPYVKHLIRPGAVRIIDSRALEQTVRAVAVLFELATGSLYLSAHFPKDLIRKRPLKKGSWQECVVLDGDYGCILALWPLDKPLKQAQSGIHRDKCTRATCRHLVNLVLLSTRFTLPGIASTWSVAYS